MLAWPFRLSLVLALLLALSAPGCSSSVDDSAEPPRDAGNDDSATEDASAAQDGPRADANESSTDAGTDDVARSSDAKEDAASIDAAISADGTPDADATCAWSGAPGQCITVAACAALSDHTSYSGECPGPATIECCIKTPSTADNPPIPAGYHLMQQSQVTPEMTAWAVSILNDPATYPMFATATKTFGALVVLARVEWLSPDFQNGAVHRGIALYVQ
jgi:hypothetical protein